MDTAVTCLLAFVRALAFREREEFRLNLSYEVEEESALRLRLDGSLLRPRLTAGTHLNTTSFLLLFC